MIRSLIKLNLLLGLTSFLLISCSKSLHKNSNASKNETSYATLIHWQLNKADLDSAKVISGHNESWWYTVVGEYQIDELNNFRLDYNTFDKSNIDINIDKANLFLEDIVNIQHNSSNYLKDDFDSKGWTYDYIVDYLRNKKYRGLEYESITKLNNFKTESIEALNNLKLKRIGFFDINFDTTSKANEGIYAILDFDIYDTDTFDVLVIKANEQGEFENVSIEG